MTPSSGTLPHRGRSYSLLPVLGAEERLTRRSCSRRPPRCVCGCGTCLTFSDARPLAADTSSAPVLYAPPDRIYFSGQATEVTGSPPTPTPTLPEHAAGWGPQRSLGHSGLWNSFLAQTERLRTSFRHVHSPQACIIKRLKSKWITLSTFKVISGIMFFFPLCKVPHLPLSCILPPICLILELTIPFFFLFLVFKSVWFCWHAF